MILETKSILYILVKIINTAFKVYSHSLNLISLPQMIFPTAMCVPCCLGYLFLPLSLLFEPAEKYYMEFNYKRKSQRKKRKREGYHVGLLNSMMVGLNWWKWNVFHVQDSKRMFWQTPHSLKHECPLHHENHSRDLYKCNK